jgi:hypothetical protein
LAIDDGDHFLDRQRETVQRARRSKFVRDVQYSTAQVGYGTAIPDRSLPELASRSLASILVPETVCIQPPTAALETNTESTAGYAAEITIISNVETFKNNDTRNYRARMHAETAASRTLMILRTG